MRREWIEILKQNHTNNSDIPPSMRGEWIEMLKRWETDAGEKVSLHAEGVD